MSLKPGQLTGTRGGFSVFEARTADGYQVGCSVFEAKTADGYQVGCSVFEARTADGYQGGLLHAKTVNNGTAGNSSAQH